MLKWISNGAASPMAAFFIAFGLTVGFELTRPALDATTLVHDQSAKWAVEAIPAFVSAKMSRLIFSKDRYTRAKLETHLHFVDSVHA